MRAVTLIAAIIAASVSAQDGRATLHGMQHLLVFCETTEQFDSVKEHENYPGFDFLRVNPEVIEVLVAGDHVQLFKAFLDKGSIRYVIAEEDVERVVEESVVEQLERQALQDDGAFFSFNYYPRHDELNEYLERIAAAYSDVATLISIGKSYEGREMKGLKLSDGRPNNPAIFVDAGIHAREWIAPVTALYVIDQLVVNATNKDYLSGIDWYIVPLFNPDGYEYTHEGTGNRMWRKTRSRHGNARCPGVDGNRNFDMAWMTIGASSNPCSDIYAGPEAFSEPETRNVRDFILGLKGRLKIYLTLHSYGQYILYPWGYKRDLPSNEPELRSLAYKCAKGIASIRNTPYTFGTSANHLYPSSGGSDDWAMDKGGADLAYTYELPGGRFGFLLPPSEIKPVGTETFEAVKLLHSYVRDKYSSLNA